MPNTREKLIELLYNFGIETNAHICDGCGDRSMNIACAGIADYLIANGVTVLECKVGDKVYQTDGVRIYESTVQGIAISDKHTIFNTENIAFDERSIGKSVFLSYAEAKAHLPQPPKGE